MRPAWWLLGVVLAALTLLPATAAAHAVLLRTDPPTGRSLEVTPIEVRLLFSEPIDGSFSRVRVLNTNGDPIDLSDSRVDPANENELVVSLPQPLPNGTYVVAWRSLSTIDVHPEVGQYPIFVGVPVATQASGAASAA